jgi:hypothetical protein
MRNAIIAIVAALVFSVGVAFVLIKQHNRLGDAYAQQALRFLIEGVPNANNDYNHNLAELEVQVSSPAERRSFDAIRALKKADDDFAEAAHAPAWALRKNADRELDSGNMVAYMRDTDLYIASLKEVMRTDDAYDAERQKVCYEPLKANIEARSSDTPKACNKK